MKMRYYHIDQECDWDAPRVDEVVLHVPLAFLDARIIRGTCPTCGGSKTVPGRGLHCPVCGWVISTEGLAGVPEHCPRCQNAVLDKCEMARDCPDCADAPVTVLEPAAWEAFVCEYACEPGATKDAMRKRWAREAATDVPEPDRDEGFDAHWSRLEEHCTELLQALLPGARVAKAVGALECSGKGNALALRVKQQDGSHTNFCVGEHIALLATQAREEAER